MIVSILTARDLSRARAVNRATHGNIRAASSAFLHYADTADLCVELIEHAWRGCSRQFAT